MAALAVRLACRFADRADLVIAPSACIAETLRARGVRARVAVVPTGVPLDRFRPGDAGAARRALGLAPEALVCLYVGRLDREKSVERVIEAFGLIAGALPEARLLARGPGEPCRGAGPPGRRQSGAGPYSARGRRRPRGAAALLSRGRPLPLRLGDGDAGPGAGRGPCLRAGRGGGAGVGRRGGGGGRRDGPPHQARRARSGRRGHRASLDPARRAAMGAAGRVVAERGFSAAGQVAAMVELYAGLRR